MGFGLPLALLIAVQAGHGTPGGAVGGMLSDTRTGQPLVGAVVALTDLGRLTLSGPEGRYVLRGVPAGPQHLSVRLVGFAPRTLHALVPDTGLVDISVALEPVPVRLQSIEVRRPFAGRGASELDTATFPDRALSAAAINQHPLLAEPDALQALSGGEVVLRPEAPSGVHVRGGGADHVAYLLDGIPVFSPYHAAGVFAAWNPDALAGIHLGTAAAGAAEPAALSGVISATTRTAGPEFVAQGSLSTSQMRFTAGGPVGARRSSWLVSGRSGLPAALAPRNETTYLRGEAADVLARLDVALFGGALRLIGYENENELGAVATVPGAAGSAAAAPRRNVFEWRGRSLGARWERTSARGGILLTAWRATADAGALWAADASPLALRSLRRDIGIAAQAHRRGATHTTTLGLRVERSRTGYAVADSAAAVLAALRVRTAIVTVHGTREATFGPFAVALAAAAAASGGRLYLSPGAHITARPTPWLGVSGSYARRHQFAQSLRNSESIAGTIFPADLYIGAGAPGVPVARSDQAIVAGELRPRASLRVGAQVWARRMGGLVLAAPRGGEPFATAGFASGGGSARGLAVDATVRTARYGLVATWGVQRVRLRWGDSSYVPEYGVAHHVEGGLTLFPSATASIRLGVAAIFGRRTTVAAGGFEWESCNVVDRGCEFAGTPSHNGEALGGTRLPAYARVDLGVRKHWHIELAGRSATVALFGTATNLLGRTNLLTWARDPSTGRVVGTEARPRSPLVVGMDWQF